MRDGGTGRRGEMNLSLQKANVSGNRFAWLYRTAGGTDGAKEREKERERREVGVFRASATPENANEPICSTSYGRREKKRERTRQDCQVVAELTQTAT